MAKNTSYQAQLDGKSSGVIKSNPLNDPSKSRVQNTNTFECGYDFLSTERYGEISPFYVANGIPKDINPLINSHELRTYTLQAPVMAEVFKHKNYFQVPMKAILPNTWDYIYTNPVQGDDVPDDAYCTCDLVGVARGCLIDMANAYRNGHSIDNATLMGSWFAGICRRLVFLESVFSNGCLLTYLGFPAHALFCASASAPDHAKSIDNFIDISFKSLIDKLPPFTVLSNTRLYTLASNPYSSGQNVIPVSLHKFMDIIREDPFIRMDFGQNVPADTIEYLNTNAIIEFANDLSDLATNIVFYDGTKIDISRLISYQLVCSHFFTNDSIDFIYSADLFRKNARAFYQKSLYSIISGSKPEVARFSYNGLMIDYDTFSGNILTYILSRIAKYFEASSSNDPSEGSVSYNQSIYALAFFSLILTYRHSLKYGDYFTGSKPFPLAVGDVNAPVTNNAVSAIDMTVNISKQRFLNAVNRFGASVDDYISGIFDSKLPPVDTDPKWLSNQDFKLFGTEIENTGAEQRDANSVTTLLKSYDGKYAFEAYADTPCIFIGVSWYSIKRVYTTSADRFFFHANRFDMFNPYLQYIGDQDIKPKEISVANRSSLAFGYTGRFMEYKQRINRAVGGFSSGALNGWSAATDNLSDFDSSRELTINPDFIRSRPDEMDIFYSSLTSLSLGNYFHFIVKYVNFNDIKRAMDYTPTIL